MTNELIPSVNIHELINHRNQFLKRYVELKEQYQALNEFGKIHDIIDCEKYMSITRSYGDKVDITDEFAIEKMTRRVDAALIVTGKQIGRAHV